MNELILKYGCNPNQKPARLFMEDGGSLPIEVLNGSIGYINALDALNGFQLVRELKEMSGLPSATSFKHVSPAGAAIGTPLSESLARSCFVDDLELSPLACAYAKARGADRVSSFGDFIALSDVCDESTARVISREVSDGVIAPGYTDEALKILKKKRKGGYSVVRIDPDYTPVSIERKQVFGVTFEQGRNDVKITKDLLSNVVTTNKKISESAITDLLLSLIVLKYTQSNSVCYALDGQAIGIGAGQQSRIHCTRLAGTKADIWWMRQHPKILSLPFREEIGRPERDNIIDMYCVPETVPDVFGIWKELFTELPAEFPLSERERYRYKLEGVSLGSDAFFPFGDSIERAHDSGVEFVAQAGGSIRDDHVIAACNKYDIAMAMTGLRLFHH